RYSFVLGRPPLIRGKEGPAVVGGGWATPADNVTNERKFLPLSGISTIFRLLITCPRPPLSVRSSDASWTTVTNSVTAPGSGTTPGRTRSPVASRTPSRKDCLNPIASTATL